jgi:hypothetical protein
MAGIGPVTTNRNDLLRRAGARPGISAPKNELEILILRRYQSPKL